MSDIELDPRWIEYKMEQYKEKESQIMNDKSVVEAQNKNELICPFCQQELRKIHPTYVICDNCRITGEDKLWQELIRTRKALKIAVDALKYSNKCIKGGCVNWETEIDKALEQITALEQKDVKQ